MEEETRKKVDIFEDEETAEKQEDKKSKKDAKESKKENKEADKLRAENDSLKVENEKLENEKTDLNNKYLMALAESKNYKKRCDDEMDRFYKYATFDMCKKLVGILDTFDLAIAKEQKDEKLAAYLDGFKMTRSQIYAILEKEGVTEIEALGKEFDPNYMVSLQQGKDETKKDQEVLQVFMKGYMYKDRVLRPANVIVNILD